MGNASMPKVMTSRLIVDRTVKWLNVGLFHNIRMSIAKLSHEWNADISNNNRRSTQAHTSSHVAVTRTLNGTVTGTDTDKRADRLQLINSRLTIHNKTIPISAHEINHYRFSSRANKMLVFFVIFFPFVFTFLVIYSINYFIFKQHFVECFRDEGAPSLGAFQSIS